MIYDLSSSYQIAFYVAGACSTVATCLLFLVPALMPQEALDDGRGRAETVHFEDSEKALLDGIRSPDSSVPTTSTKASLGSCQKLNSNLRFAPSQSYLDRYWDMPKRTSMRASMASLLSFSPLQPPREVLVVVEKVSQVWEIGRRLDFKRHHRLYLPPVHVNPHESSFIACLFHLTRRAQRVLGSIHLSTLPDTHNASAPWCVTAVESHNAGNALF